MKNLKNLSGIYQIRQLAVFTFQRNDVNGHNMLNIVEMNFEKNCLNNKINLNQIDITR